MTNKNPLSPELKRRATKSFLIFFASAVLILGLIGILISRQSPTDRAPAPFRQVLELNGKIWKKIFNVGRKNESFTPITKEPRINGLVGLEEEIDPETWTMQVVANDQNPNSRHVTISLKEVKALPRTDTNLEFRCIEGWSEDMSFAGVRFSDFMKAYNLQALPYVGFETNDGKYYVSVDIESLMHEQTLLAYEMNGAPLKQANGAPLRLVIPTKYGIKNLKRIGKIFFSEVRPRDYWAERGYDWHASL